MMPPYTAPEVRGPLRRYLILCILMPIACVGEIASALAREYGHDATQPPAVISIMMSIAFFLGWLWCLWARRRLKQRAKRD